MYMQERFIKILRRKVTIVHNLSKCDELGGSGKKGGTLQEEDEAMQELWWRF